MAELKKTMAPRKCHITAESRNLRLDAKVTKLESKVLDELVAMSPYKSRSEYLRAAVNAFAGKEVFHND